MKMKNLLALLLALVMVFALCACGNNAEKEETEGKEDPKETTAPKDNGAETTKPTEQTPADNNVEYKVKVVDETGAPVANAMVQMCLDACIPGITDANGVATFKLPAENYKVSFVQIPDGYSCDSAAFYFEGESTELTITLKSAAATVKEYKVKFVDASGNPVTGVAAQMVKESGAFGAVTTSDEEGVVGLNTLDFCTGVKIVTLPEGYTADAMEVAFADGATELTITLKAA